MRSLRPWNWYAVAGVALSSVCGTVSPMMFLVRDMNGRSMDPAAVDLGLAMAFNTASAVGMFGTAIPWALWQHAAAMNLRQRAPDAQKHSPGRGVALLFIPIVNLFTTRRVLADLWRGSSACAAPAELSHPAARRVPIVSLWLAAWLTVIVVGQMDRYVFSVFATKGALAQTATVTLFSVLRAVAGAFAIAIVARITAMQESWPWSDPDAATD